MGGLMRPPGGFMRLHGNLIGVSWGPSEGNLEGSWARRPVEGWGSWGLGGRWSQGEVKDGSGRGQGRVG